MVILQQKSTVMTNHDYSKCFEAFRKALDENPDLKLNEYCAGIGLPWRRLYDWMSRRHYSLRVLYEAAREKSGNATLPVPKNEIEFTEIHPRGTGSVSEKVGRLMLTLPSGVIVEMTDCPSRVLSMLTVSVWERRRTMFALDDKIRFYLCQRPVSMRYGIRGLTNLILSYPGFSPMSGCAFVFFSSDRRQVKILRWDVHG